MRFFDGIFRINIYFQIHALILQISKSIILQSETGLKICLKEVKLHLPKKKFEEYFPAMPVQDIRNMYHRLALKKKI
jgi:hypothetical protein